ncbi:glycoside hydrolase family 16 protein, partial [Streptomyces sp. NPDC005791]
MTVPSPHHAARRIPKRRRTMLRTALTLLCCSVAMTALPAGASAAPDPHTVAPFTASRAAAAVTFADEFDGPAGSAVDGGKWQTETGDNV